MPYVDRSVYNRQMIESTRRRRRSDTHDLILRTAHNLFYRNGIRATGIDRVIAESQVTKVTFYRHFPSKENLIREFLEYRHERWMSWFVNALTRHGANGAAVVAALQEWLRKPEFRGCAFINVVAEMPGADPEIAAIARRHKADVRRAIARVLPASPLRSQIASSLALAFDGAIVRAQMDGNGAQAVAGLRRIERALLKETRTAPEPARHRA
jgi:AcrR family transcriptional regulator